VLVGPVSDVDTLATTIASSAPRATRLGGCPPGASAPANPIAVLGAIETLKTNPPLVPPGATVLLALPVAMRQLAADLAAALPQSRWLPPIADQLAGRITWTAGTGPSPGAISLDPSQLLDREPHHLDRPAIAGVLTGKTVLITGAGGSIGSELARLVAGFSPAKLILVERGENALFEIDREIARTFPALARSAILHDVTNAPGTRWVLGEHRPQVIFHAAAHKHVPMMEDHPAQAVENNFYGTRSIADAAQAAGVERFVMISTDKAVNPTSVMGATKRLAELYVQHLAASSPTLFCMVRFGNVLGSACSVLPIWSQQLAAGGPLTVTHPDMTRYFMTIPEAAGLVLQSAALTQGGEVFLLDMGQPIRIVDLAQRFVRAHGLEPARDVDIQFTGIRPGEKLFEELAYDGEDMIPTPHESVRIWRTQPPGARRMKAIIARFDAMREGTRRPPRSRSARGALSADLPPASTWQHATRQAILAALHDAIPEMRPAAQTPAPSTQPEISHVPRESRLPAPLAAAG